MSDSPQGPNWWKATDGRWYPPELFTGPPELRPGASDSQERQEPSEPGEPRRPLDDTPPGRRRPPVAVVLAIVAAVVLAAAGAWWLLGTSEEDEQDAPARTESTSRGPVRIVGTLRVDSSVPVAEIAPTSCDEWAQLLRVEVQTPSGSPVTNFAPRPVEAADATRADGIKSLSCDFEYLADVPADSGYVLAILNIRDAGRPTSTESLDGAEEGEIDVPPLSMTFSCDNTSGCVLRRAG